MGRYQAVLMWSSEGANDGRDLRTATAGKWYDGTAGDACEFHGGENNSSGQRRLAPATGKYANLPGLSWMRDIKSFGTSYSGNPGDDNVGGGGNGTSVAHDYVRGGPYAQLSHIHVLDCAGADYLTLYWRMKCMNYEGLAIDPVDANLATNIQQNWGDLFRLEAYGMPAVDSTDSLYSLPRAFRLNDKDGLATEGAASFVDPRQQTFTATSADVITPAGSARVWANDDTFTVVAGGGLPGGLAANLKYFVVQYSAGTFKASLSQGGGAVDITGAGTPPNYILKINENSEPGTGNSPRCWMPAMNVSDPGWMPQNWVLGSDMLWYSGRSQAYQGTDTWLMYDQCSPAYAFETSGSEFGLNSVARPSPAMTQFGKVWTDTNKLVVRRKWIGAGDIMELSIRLGYPVWKGFATTGQSSPSINLRVQAPELKISGLARIAFIIGSIGSPWGTDSTNSPLISTPVGPAVAPRQHNRGRLWAVLS